MFLEESSIRKKVLQSHLDRDDYNMRKGFDLSVRALGMCKIVRFLSGPPISSAITLDCPEAVSALLYEIQIFAIFSISEASALEAAFSCHRSQISRSV